MGMGGRSSGTSVAVVERVRRHTLNTGSASCLGPKAGMSTLLPTGETHVYR